MFQEPRGGKRAAGSAIASPRLLPGPSEPFARLGALGTRWHFRRKWCLRLHPPAQAHFPWLQEESGLRKQSSGRHYDTRAHTGHPPDVHHVGTKTCQDFVKTSLCAPQPLLTERLPNLFRESCAPKNVSTVVLMGFISW